jgi:hypothetical protein
MSETRLKISPQVQDTLGIYNEEARLNPESLASIAALVGAELSTDVFVELYGAGEVAKIPGAQGKSRRLAPEIHPVRKNVLRVNADNPPTPEGVRGALAQTMFDRYDLNPGLRWHVKHWQRIGAVGYSMAAGSAIAIAPAGRLAEQGTVGPILGVATLAIAGLTKVFRDRFWNSRTMPDVSDGPFPVEFTEVEKL